MAPSHKKINMVADKKIALPFFSELIKSKNLKS